MAEAYESITKFITEAGLIVRVWATEESETTYNATHTAVTDAIRDHDDTAATIATAIRENVSNWAAYEIADRFGNGRVVYREWP